MALDNNNSTLDFVVFGWLVLVSITFMIVLLIIAYKRHKYQALRYKQPMYLYALCVFGIVASWSVFIANDHISILNPIRAWSCSLWSYWLSHVFGINMWFTIMIVRLFDKMFIFHKRLSILSDNKKFALKLILSVTTIIVPLEIAVNVSIFGLSEFDDRYFNSCESELEAKLALIAWYGFCYIIFNILFLILERDIHNIYFNEYLTLNHIVAIAQYVFVTNIVLNLTGAIHYTTGRFFYTFNISFLFLFTILRICGYSIYKALINDTQYDENTVTNYVAYYIRYNTLFEMATCHSLYEKYVEYAYVLLKMEQEDPDKKKKRLFEFDNLRECINEISALQYSAKKERKTNKILTDYFSKNAIYILGLDDKERSTVAVGGNFYLARFFIMNRLETYFYGKSFLQIVNEDADKMFQRIKFHKNRGHVKITSNSNKNASNKHSEQQQQQNYQSERDVLDENPKEHRLQEEEQQQQKEDEWDSISINNNTNEYNTQNDKLEFGKTNEIDDDDEEDIELETIDHNTFTYEKLQAKFEKEDENKRLGFLVGGFANLGSGNTMIGISSSNNVIKTSQNQRKNE